MGWDPDRDDVECRVGLEPDHGHGPDTAPLAAGSPVTVSWVVLPVASEESGDFFCGCLKQCPDSQTTL